MSPRHFFHELRRVARESYLPALVPTAVIMFCLGVWHFLWAVREPDPSQAAALTDSHRQLLRFFNDWWVYVGWIFPYLIVKRLDTEDATGMQRTLPLTRRELLGAKLTFTVLLTVVLPTVAFAVYQAAIHPENWVSQTGTVAATQWVLACVGASVALFSPGARGPAWLAGAYVLFQYVSGATGSLVLMLIGREPAPVFDGSFSGHLADACLAANRYAPLILAPLAVALLASGFRRLRPSGWLILTVPVAILTPLTQRLAYAPRFAKSEAPQQVAPRMLTASEAKSMTKEPWFKRFGQFADNTALVPVARTSVTLNASGLVPGITGNGGWWPLNALPAIRRYGDRTESTQVSARIATRVESEAFTTRKSSYQETPVEQVDHNDRIARLIATGVFPRDVRFWRLGATPDSHDWQTVEPSADEVKLDLTLTSPAHRNLAGGEPFGSVTVEVPFTRYATPEVVLRAPAKDRNILRERDLTVTIPPVFDAHGHRKQKPGKLGELRTDIACVYRSGPFLKFGETPWRTISWQESTQYVFVVFNPVKKQAAIIPADNLNGGSNLWATPANTQHNTEAPWVDQDWLKESELLVVRLRTLETVKRLVEIRPDATATVEKI